jgi:chromosome segregation ATPase
MVDVDSVLLSVQERDKWRRRMELLGKSLEEVRERRHRAEERLRRVKQELARLRATGEAVVDMARRTVIAEAPRGATTIVYSGR